MACVTGEALRVTASSRTDAGVHAQGQIVSCTGGTPLDAGVLRRALNANLPGDVRVVDLEVMPSDFHAIRDTVAKRYRYVIQNGRVHDVFQRGHSWFIARPLNVSAMRRAARHLVGTHDFASLQSAGSPRKSTVRTIHELTLRSRVERGLRWIVIEVEADGFLYNMVRNLVGTLCMVGLAKRPPDWIVELLLARDRRLAGPTAPPQGLCLLRVTLAAPCLRCHAATPASGC